jgi:hypothetical protein
MHVVRGVAMPGVMLDIVTFGLPLKAVGVTTELGYVPRGKRTCWISDLSPESGLTID